MTQPHNKTYRTAFTLRLDKLQSQGRLTPQQCLCLGMMEIWLREAPDGTFAETLVSLLQEGA